VSRKTNIPEDELVALLMSKDKDAFRILYDNYSSTLYGIVLKIVGTTEVAEDVLQEAFVKIWKNISSYDKTKGRLFTWLLNIARNTAIDKLRAKNEKYQIQSIDDSVYQVDKQSSSTMKVDHIGVKQNVQQLKPEHRIIIDMAYYGGYTQEEISEELKIPLGTVKTRMRNAIIELRKIF
jgi:RNA polymerase sigma-70 factor (ECF subfamily)